MYLGLHSVYNVVTEMGVIATVSAISRRVIRVWNKILIKLMGAIAAQVCIVANVSKY